MSHEAYKYVEYAPEDTDDAIRKVDEAQVACGNPNIEQVDDELLAGGRYGTVQGFQLIFLVVDGERTHARLACSFASRSTSMPFSVHGPVPCHAFASSFRREL